MIALSSAASLVPRPRASLANEYREIGSTDPVYPRSLASRIGSRQRNTPPSACLLRAHRVHRRHHLRRIHNFARSLPNRLLALSLYPSLPFFLISPSSSLTLLSSRPLFSRIRCVTKLSRCPQASISMPNVATRLNVVRNSSTLRLLLSLRPFYRRR